MLNSPAHGEIKSGAWLHVTGIQRGPHLFHDGLRQGQPQSQAFTAGLGREKWLKQMGLDLWAQPRSVVPDGQCDLCGIGA